MTARDTNWLREQLAYYDSVIPQYRTAITALSSGAQSYRIHTGQTDTQVTKANLAQVRVTLEGLIQERANVYAQLNGGPAVNARPAW